MFINNLHVIENLNNNLRASVNIGIRQQYMLPALFERATQYCHWKHQGWRFGSIVILFVRSRRRRRRRGTQSGLCTTVASFLRKSLAPENESIKPGIDFYHKLCLPLTIDLVWPARARVRASKSFPPLLYSRSSFTTFFFFFFFFRSALV